MTWLKSVLNLSDSLSFFLCVRVKPTTQLETHRCKGKRQYMFRFGSHHRKYFLSLYILTVFHNLCASVKVLLTIQLIIIITPAEWERKCKKASTFIMGAGAFDTPIIYLQRRWVNPGAFRDGSMTFWKLSLTFRFSSTNEEHPMAHIGGYLCGSY